MRTGLTNLGKKPSPASPGNYVRDYVRSKKNRALSKRKGSPPSVTLLPSSKPVPVELTARDTSISGFGMVGIIFMICLALFVLMTLLG